MKTLPTQTNIIFSYKNGNPFLEEGFRDMIAKGYKKAGGIQKGAKIQNSPDGLRIKFLGVNHAISVLQYEFNSNRICMVHQTPLGHGNLEQLCEEFRKIKKKSIGNF